jgi:hypothetical protein
MIKLIILKVSWNFKGLRSQKKSSLLFVNEHFSDGRNAEAGILLLTLLAIIICFHIDTQAVNAQIYKHIDRFESNRYYPAFINGKGILRDTIIKSQGLLINYHFDTGSGSGFTLIRNYDIAPQDYSFMPDKLTLTLKGGNKTDQIRFRLWEDINMNRKLDSADEVYASKPYPLGGTVWHTIQFPLNSFKRVTGKGNNIPDLNRIRAWDIEVESLSDESHSGGLYLNDLRFYSNYKPKTSKKAALTGTFITVSVADSGKNGYWSQQQWNSQLWKMKKMDLSKIIVQYSIHQNRAWYSPSKISFVNCSVPVLNKIFIAAGNVGIKVYLGLSFSESWYKSDKASEDTYSNLYLQDKDIIDELYSLFGTNKTFSGWYIPQEINDYDWQTEYKKTLLFSWLQQVALYAHKKDASKTVIIAPYFNLWQPADIIETWYNELLDIAKDIDWVYLQDGVGTTLKDVHIDIPNFGSHIKAACEKHCKKFGVTVESFRQITGWPVDNGIFSARSANIKQLYEQIQEAYQLNPSDIILFEWNYLNMD